MIFGMTVSMDNVAFDDNQGPELARILRELADRVDEILDLSLELESGVKLYDSNGNRVGDARISGI